MAATETLKRSRTVQFNISLDGEALMKALGKKEKKEDEDDVEEKEESPTKRVLKKMREGTL